MKGGPTKSVKLGLKEQEEEDSQDSEDRSVVARDKERGVCKMGEGGQQSSSYEINKT